MVTTRQAEGFSPPTTKGTEPAISGMLEGGFICPFGHCREATRGQERCFPVVSLVERGFSVASSVLDEVHHLDTQTLFATRPVIEMMANLLSSSYPKNNGVSGVAVFAAPPLFLGVQTHICARGAVKCPSEATSGLRAELFSTTAAGQRGSN